MTFDNWAYYLNTQLRSTSHLVAIQKNPEPREALKKIIKELEEKLFNDLKDGNNKFGELSVLHIMFYSYLDPVKQMATNAIK